jgi:tRNA pseudouridine38-40 synthase
MSRTFHLTIAYDGSAYAGWQVQPGERTIQGELELAAATLSGKSDPSELRRILGSGRTDAGVHAWGQVARLVLPDWRADALAIQRGLNSQLPDDISVLNVRETVDSFHPIADAVAKRYRYQIQIAGNRDPFATRTRTRIKRALDTEKMQAAATRFLGEHDFAAFQAAGSPRPDTIRTITHSQWTQEPGPLLGIAGVGDRWYYEVEGNGFLYNMVRNLVGTMLAVATGKRSLSWIDEVIASKDRKRAGATAAAHGLVLVRVDYPNDIFLS